MADLTQEQLEEMVEGKKPNPRAIFFEHAVLNVPESRAAGRRIYEKKIYIKLSHPGVADSVSYEAQKRDIAQYPKEYEYFMQNRQGTRRPGIEIIPNLDIAHLQELRDGGVLTISQLAALEVVPPHLEYAHRAAITLNRALQESSHDSEEKPRQEATQTEDVYEADRPEHGHDVGRRGFSPGNGRNEVSESTQRHDESRPPHRDKGVNLGSCNWSIEFVSGR